MNQPTHQLNEVDRLDALAARLMAAKTAEHDARNVRIACEEALLDVVGIKDEGSFSIAGDMYKVTTTQPITRKVLKAGLPEVSSRMGVDIFDALFIAEPKLNVKLLKELRQHNPEAYMAASIAIESKPGKPSVKVEVIS